MNPLRKYDIAFVGLKIGIHEFSFDIDDRFFESFPGSIVEKAAIDLKLRFDKRNSFFILHFHLDGNVQLPCDRCGTELNYPVHSDYDIVVKFDEHREEERDDSMADVIYIGRNETHLNVAQLIYEFVNLSIPIHHVTCDNLTEPKPCNQEILDKLNHTGEETQVDHRWDALTKIKFK